MNIVIDIRCLTQTHRTGVGEYTYELLDALFKNDTKHEYFLFYNSFREVSDVIPQWKMPQVHYIATRWPGKLLNALIYLKIIKLDTFIQKRMGRKRDIDYFFAPNINFISLSKKVKLLLTIHDLSFEFLPECFSWRRRLWHWLVAPQKLCRRAHRIVTPSQSTRHDVMLEYGVHGDNIHCIYPGLSSAFECDDQIDEVYKKRIQKKYGLPSEYILYLGTLEPRKNIDLILSAYEKMNSRDKRTPLVIAGGRGWHYHDIIRRIDHISNVYYIGYVEQQDKIAIYDKARVFVFPSLYEGFGFPVLEAMSRGLPVITTSRSSLPEVMGEFGMYVQSHDVRGLVSCMQHVLNHSALYDMMGRAAQKKSKQFQWDHAAEEFLLLLKS